MLLVINIENNNVHFGLFQSQKLVHKFKIKTDLFETVDELKLKIKMLMDPFSLETISDSIISSVVPDITKKYLQIFPNSLIVGAGIKTGINIKCENTKEVGSDRIIKAVFAMGEKALIMSLDEVITIDFVNGNNFMGGMIIPGITMSLNSLKEMAKLSKVEILKTDELIGNSTTKALQTGLYTHYISTIEYVTDKMKKEHHGIRIVATGEHSHLLTKGIEGVEIIENMDLYGLEKIFNLNKKQEII